MFDWLIPLLIVAALPIWILDYLGLLEVVGAVFELIGAVIAGVVRLATYLIGRSTGPANPQP
jgi:chromate transport protein ChrA